MNKFLHIFVYLENKSDDKYYGIKKQILDINHSCFDLDFSDKSQKTFNKVEYSSRKLFREFYYKELFKELEEKLLFIIKENRYKRKIILYSQDEGVWSELLRFLIKKHNLSFIKFINVQHGFLMNHSNNIARTRFIKFINSFYILFFGYPKFGIGPFHGPFDYYLLFHEELRKNVISSAKSISCPNLINKSFIEKFQSINDIEYDEKSVLVALPYFVKFGSHSFETLDFEKTMLSIKPLIKTIKYNFNYNIYLRKHPNTPKDIFQKMLIKTDLQNDVLIDNLEINESIFRSPIIFSFFSTTLFEAKLVNHIPVIINNNSFDMNYFPINYKSINMKEDLSNQFEKIINIEHESNDFNDEINWKEIVEKNFG